MVLEEGVTMVAVYTTERVSKALNVVMVEPFILEVIITKANIKMVNEMA